MIPAIQEINFPSYATLSQATVSLQEMGDRTISSQIKIDGDVVPSFDGWELRFKGERFILPVKEPQAAKDNSSRRSVIDLTFQSWSVFQMKRYFFVSMSQIDTGTAIPDQYNASVILPIEGFVQLFNKVLQYYFGDAIRMDLFGAGTPGLYSQEPVVVEINKTYIWDVLVKFYELFGYRWRIEYDSVSGAHVIKVNYDAPAITDHDFEYGYQGGLLKFERQVQDTNISNVLIGRGGEKNLPYRYFKLQDPNNTAFAADPDAIPELANIYFDRLRDANFRWYVRGWMQNSHRDTSWDATHTFPTYTDADCPEPFLFAFHKGQTDEKFNPIEYVKDDASIAKYGERWGAVEDNDEAFPTIQGREVTGLGRVDEVVDVSPIVTDDIDAAAKAAATYIEIGGNKTVTLSLGTNSSDQVEMTSEPFTVPSDNVGNIQRSILRPFNGKTGDEYPEAVVAMDTAALNLRAVDESTGTEYPASGLAPGTYRLKFTLKATNYSSQRQSYVTFGLNTLQLVLSSADADAWKPTFDIWVKNIWQSEQLSGESDEEYARRVWEPILGDRAGNEAKVVFSTGFMSASQDYEFVIASYPVKDRSKTITSGGVNYDSEWKITLRKSDAEYEATGLYIPNATTGGAPAAGDHFFFIGIDMPFQYVVWGEEFLNGALNTPVVNKTAALDNLADINPSWVIQLDKVRCNTHEGAEYGQYLADRLSAGATVNIRDVRFTGGQVLTLYVQTINYVWNEPTDDNPYLVPDIDVVLSDKVIATEGPVARVTNELEMVKTTYAKSADIEQVVRQVGGALFLKKTGESDRSTSPTSFASAVQSDDFRQGDFGGAGWGHYEDGDGDSVLELDKLVIRKELRVNELVSNQIAYVGGKSIRSAASIQCTQVVEDANYYYCYFDQKQGTVKNLFVVGDFAMGQDFDENNAETRYYRMAVSGVGVDYIRLSKAGRDGAGAPQKGDTIVQYGNSSVAGRQYVIIEDVIGGGLQRMLSGLNSVSAAGKEYYFAGKQNNGERWFVGDANGEHAEWKNGQLNVKGRFSVLKQDGTYESMSDYINSMDYLRAATNEGTLIDGGLVLTSMIQLGYTADQVYHVMAGINGKPDEALSDQTKSIAAWFGGPMVDKDAAGSGSGSGTGDSYAKSLFRMDGSGYLAGGNIYWNKQGYGGIPGVTWSREGGQDIVTIGGNVKLVSASGDTVTELLTAVQSLTSMFEDETYVDGHQTKHRIKVKSGYAGLYAEGFLTAGGVGSGGSGGQGVDLPRVWQSLQNASDPVTPTANTKIAASHLVTTDPYETVGLILGQGLSYNPNTRVLSVSTLGTVTSVAGVSPVNGDVPVASLRTALGLGDAAYKGIGSVASGNTDLVTGGSVYSAINSAISSAIKFQGITTTPLTDGSTTQTITIDGESYTAQRGDEVIYGGKEFLWTGSKWQQLGDEESWALKTVSITGTGYLTGGGTLEQNRTIDLTSAAGTKLENGATAYGWGNHANAGYLLATTAANTYATITALNGVSGRVTTLENRQNWDDIFGIDSDGNVYVKKRTVSGQEVARGFYSYSFVTAGGVGSGGGGGGGVDLPRVWQSLTNASALVESGTSTKIHTDHFPTLSAANGLTASYCTPSGSGATLATYLNLGVAAGYKLPTTSEWAGKANASALAGKVSKGGDTMTGQLGVPSLLVTSTGQSYSGLYNASQIETGGSAAVLYLYNDSEVRIYGSKIRIKNALNLENNTLLSITDTGHTDRGVLFLTANNVLDFGRGTAEQGFNTYIYGNSITFNYGTSKTVGLTLKSNGVVNVANSVAFAYNSPAEIGKEWSSSDSNMYSFLKFAAENETDRNTKGGIQYYSGKWTSSVCSEIAHAFYVRDYPNTACALAINNYGYIGVLNTSPQYPVDVTGSLNATTLYENGTALSSKYLALSGGSLSGRLTITASRQPISDDAPLLIENTIATSSIPWGIGVKCSGMNTGTFMANIFGVAYSTNNAIDLSFYYAGSGSLSNYVGIGFYANDNLFRVYANGSAWCGGPIEGATIKKTGGVSTEFLKADGSVDSNTYLTTGSASSTYVAKSGDTMSGVLYSMQTGNAAFIIQYGGNDASKYGYYPNGGYTYLSAESAQCELRIKDSGSISFAHFSGTTFDYDIYHQGNANLTSVPWSASNLNLNGSISGATTISATYNQPNYYTAILTINGLYNSSWGRYIDILCPNIPTGYWQSLILGGPSHNTNNQIDIAFYYAGSTSTSNALGLGFYNNDSILTIKASQRVGINNTTPAYELDVIGTTRTSNAKFRYDTTATIGQEWSSGDSNIYSYIEFIGYGSPSRTTKGLGIDYVSGMWTSSGNDPAHRFKTTAGLALIILNNKYVGINNPNPQYALDVTGVIHSTTGIFSDGYVTAGAAQSASDSRLKGNIRDLQRDPIALIKLLRPREWDWNQYSTVQGHAMGFVAQEVQNYLPFMIGSVKDKHLGNRLTLGYEQFHALWAAGLQNHESRIDKIERENKEFRKENSELKQKVQELQNRLQTINN